MKIALLGTTLFRQGSEYVLTVLARELSKRGHDVTVILSKIYDDWRKAHPDWKPFDLGDKVHVAVLPARRIRANVFPLRKIFVKNRFDVVLEHAGQLRIPMLVGGALMRKGPVLIHVEHLWVGVDSKGIRIEPRKTLWGRLYNWILRHLDAQFVVSEGTADALVRMTGYSRERIYTVYNPVVDDVFERKRQETPTHPWLREAAIPVVVAAGAFIPVKNYELLLRAWAKVVKKYKARLVIFGEGDLRGEYEKLIGELNIGDSVSLPGFTDNLPAELKKASGFVVSSYVESFSVVLVEALASGIPVVSTDCPYGPGEILQRGRYGILVKNNDVMALANGIMKVLDGTGIRPSPESYAPFMVDTVVERYLSAIKDVLSKRELKL